MDALQLQPYIHLLIELNQLGLNVPQPLHNDQQQHLISLHHKPALLCPRLPGVHPDCPNHPERVQAGAALAKLHLASPSLNQLPQASLKPEQIIQAADPLLAEQSHDQQTLFNQAFAEGQAFWRSAPSLPFGLIHGDLKLA